MLLIEHGKSTHSLIINKFKNNLIIYTCYVAGGEMQIFNKTDKDTGIITFEGKTLGEPTDSKTFESQLRTLLELGISRIILDLQYVHRINSTGLAILITATTLLANCGGKKVSLVGSNDFIQGALTLTRLNQFFDYYDDLEQAIGKVPEESC